MLGNLVTRKRLPSHDRGTGIHHLRPRVINRIHPTKVACTHQIRRNGHQIHVCSAMVDYVFYREKEERSILDNGAADVSAECVVVYWSTRSIETKLKICSIQGGVSEIVIPQAVELVRSALADLVIENTSCSVLRRGE